MSIKFEDPEGQKQFLTSIFCNNIDEIEKLIRRNRLLLDHNFGEPFNKTALEIACCEFISVIQDETVKFLIQNGADGPRALYFAAIAGNLEIMGEILKNKYLGDNLVIIYLIEYMNNNNKHEDEYIDVLRLVLYRNMDINVQTANGSTAIYLAAKYGYAKMVNVILNICKDKVDLDSYTDKKLITARDMIKMNIKLTEKLSAPIYVQDSKISLKTLLMYIRQKRENDFLLAYKDFFPENFDKDNHILLLAAAERGLVNIVRYFLYVGVDSNKIFKYYSELFPLKFACLRGHYEVVEVLLKYADSSTINNCILELVRTKFEVMESVKINHRRCYELLLENELLDINFKDENKNTVLHYAVKHQSSEIILMTLRRGASLASRNDSGKMNVELIDAKTLEQHLDECVIFSKYDNVPNRNMVDFNFTSLLPNTVLDDYDLVPLEEDSNEHFFESNVLKYISSKPELHHLLQHPVLDVFLYLKWEGVKNFVLFNLVIYILFVINLALYISWNHICNMNEFMTGIYVLLKVVLALLLFVLIGRELIQIFIFRFQYFKSYENWVELILIGSTITLLFTQTENRVLLNQVCAVAVVCAAIELMLLSGRQFKIFFISSMMLRTVSMTLFKWFMSYAILILAFSCAFFFIFSNRENKFFLNPYDSLFRTFVMVTGEFDLTNLDFNEHYIIGPMIFIVFVFLINIVLLGICTALAISDIQKIINDAETQTQIVKIEHILYCEKVLNTRNILSFEHWFQGYLKLKVIQKEPIIKINIKNDIKIDVYKITRLYKNKLNLEKKTVKNIIAKTEKCFKYNIKEYPTVDESFFFNLRSTF